MNKPGFYGIGAQKAGTTWLHKQLKQHPQVFMPPLKEIHYFNHLYIPEHRKWTDKYRENNLNWMVEFQKQRRHTNEELITYLEECKTNKLNDEWYLHFFSLGRDEQIKGEITPAYSLLPEKGIRHMLRLNPDAKFILLLRHPVDRDFSNAKMILKAEGGLKGDGGMNDRREKRLLEIIEMPEVCSRSDYRTIIERWQNTLPKRENLFIGSYDWIKHRPHDLLKEICKFLEINYRDDYFKQTDKVVFKGSPMNITEKIRDKLFKRHEETIDYVNDNFGWYKK